MSDRETDRRLQAAPETNPAETDVENETDAPSVKEETEADRDLPDDQEAMQPDSS